MSSYFHSASQSCPILSANCKYNLRLFRLFRGDSSGMDKSSSAKCLLYSDVAKGEPSPTGTARMKKKQRWKRQSRSWRFSFDKYFTTFFYLFLLFNYFTLSFFFYTFLTHDIYPHPHPRPTPTTSTHYPLHLATLFSSRLKLSWIVSIFRPKCKAKLREILLRPSHTNFWLSKT